MYQVLFIALGPPLILNKWRFSRMCYSQKGSGGLQLGYGVHAFAATPRRATIILIFYTSSRFMEFRARTIMRPFWRLMQSHCVMSTLRVFHLASILSGGSETGSPTCDVTKDCFQACIKNFFLSNFCDPSSPLS
jgi:hypothetical protein